MTFIAKHEPFDFKKARIFYDPYPLPGFFGDTINLDYQLKAIIDSLDGQTISVSEAIDKFSKAGALVSVVLGQIKNSASDLTDPNSRFNGIVMEIAGTDAYTLHYQVCLIKFR